MKRKVEATDVDTTRESLVAEAADEYERLVSRGERLPQTVQNRGRRRPDAGGVEFRAQAGNVLISGQSQRICHSTLLLEQPRLLRELCTGPFAQPVHHPDRHTYEHNERPQQNTLASSALAG